MHVVPDRSLHLALVLTASCLSADIAPGEPGWPASYPVWWYRAEDPARGVIDATRLSRAQDNAALLNQGQLWNLAAQGIEELETQLAPIGGADFTLSDLSNGQRPHYYAAVNIGQLKHAASQFFDRFAAIGFVPGSSGWPGTPSLDSGTGYPWASNISPDNLRPANIGQAKQLWSWDLRGWIGADDDADGLPDWWERYQMGSLDYDASHQQLEQGLSLAEAYAHHLNPNLLDSDFDGFTDRTELDWGWDPGHNQGASDAAQTRWRCGQRRTQQCRRAAFRHRSRPRRQRRRRRARRRGCRALRPGLLLRARG